MRKKLIFAFIIVVGLILIILLLRKDPPPEYSISPPIGQNIQEAHTRDGEVYFFTGHGFAKYIVSSQKTVSLTDFIRFPQIVDLDISSTGAVFRTNETYPTDDLYSYLSKKKLLTDSSRWWYVDFTSGELKLLGEEEGISTKIVASQLNDTSLFVATNEKDKSSLYQRKNKGLRQVHTAPDESIINIPWASEEKVIFSSKKEPQDPARLTVFSLSNNATELMPENVVGDVKVNSNGNLIVFQALGVDEEDSTSKFLAPGVYLYKIGKKKPSLLFKEFTGRIVPDSFGGFHLAGEISEEAYFGRVDEKGDSVKALLLDRALSVNYSHISPIDANLEELVVTDDQDLLYLLSVQPKDFKALDGVPTEAQRIDRPKYSIVYLASSNNFSILVKKNPFKNNVEQAIKELEDAGLDSNQYELSAQPVRGLNSGQ